MKGLFTTKKDLSAVYFKTNGWDVFDYDSVDLATLKSKNYDIVYFRDPFNDPTIRCDLPEIDSLIKMFSDARGIDNIRSTDDMLRIEDKFFQANLYKDYCPYTFLPSQGQFIRGKHLAKKRISQRAKDILFEPTAPIDDNWIIQELIDIKEELRVYVVFGKVIEKATIKTSKQSGKVKVIGGRELTMREKAFCEKVAKISGLDFIGIDLAILEDGTLKLIEVNRSPQFKRFVEMYGEDPLEDILKI